MSANRISAKQYSVKQIDSLYTFAHNTEDLRENLAVTIIGYKASLKINYQEGIMKFLRELSYCYFTMGDYNNALKYMEESEAYCKKLHNYHYLYWNLYRKSFIYRRLGFDKQCYIVHKSMAALLPKMKGDDFFDCKGEYLKQHTYFKLPADSILYYQKLSLNNFKRIKDKFRRNEAICDFYVEVIENLIDSCHVKSASAYVKPARKQIDTLSTLTQDRFYRAALFENLGYIHYKNNNADSAIFYYKKALPVYQKRNDLHRKIKIFLKLYKAYNLKKNLDSTTYYKEQYMNSKAELSGLRLKSIDCAYDEILKNKDEEYKATQFQISVWILLILVVVCIVIFLLVNRLEKEKQQKQNIESSLENTSKAFLELESKINNMFEDVVELAKKNDPSFLTRFQEAYPEFFKNLLNKYPELLKTELILCAYLKLNFSTKEIANFTFVTTKAIEMRKSRFRKKMDIPSGEDLYVWINKI